MFKRIDHIEIVTDQIERSEAFYTEVLGFVVKARERIERSPMVLNLTYLTLGGTSIELMSYDGIPVESAPDREHLGYRMMALEVDDMDDTAAFLKSKGVEIAWGPMVVPGKYARAEICDPNGYRIELRHWF